MEEAKEKILKIIKQNLIGLIIAVLSIIGSISYVLNNKCEKCEIKEKIIDVESTMNVNKLIEVDVKGAVKNPKVYALEEGATVEDAITMAGGITKEGVTKNINLSKKLKDEMVVYVFTKSEIEAQTLANEVVCEVPKCECETIDVSGEISASNNPSNNSSNKNNNAIISINTATESELTMLDGIGPAKAKAIIEYRNANGPFKTIEDIKNVSGIGESAFEKIKSKITT